MMITINFIFFSMFSDNQFSVLMLFFVFAADSSHSPYTLSQVPSDLKSKAPPTTAVSNTGSMLETIINY